MERTNFYDAIYSPVILILNAVVVAVVMLLSASGNQKCADAVSACQPEQRWRSSIIFPRFSHRWKVLGMEIQTIQSAIAGIHRINEFFALEERTENPAWQHGAGG